MVIDKCAFMTLTSNLLGGTIENIIKNFKEYNQTGFDYCDCAVDSYLPDFIEYIDSLNPSKDQYKAISELCMERAKSVFNRSRNNHGKNELNEVISFITDKIIEGDDPKQFYYEWQIYCFYNAGQVFSKSSMTD